MIEINFNGNILTFIHCVYFLCLIPSFKTHSIFISLLWFFDDVLIHANEIMTGVRYISHPLNMEFLVAESLTSLSNLVQLDVRKNKLQSLPAGIGSLLNLTCLKSG